MLFRSLPDLIGIIDLHVDPPDSLNVWNQGVITVGSFTAHRRVSRLGCAASVTRWGNLQDLADRIDLVHITMTVDIRLQLFSRWPGSAWAKTELAVLRVSLARRSSLTAHSNALTRLCSDVVVPALAPVSTSSRLTHSLLVCGTQPIFEAIDSMAAHSDRYSPRCSCTIRTARSRTSGENLFELFMAQSSQRFEPPQHTGQFRLTRQHNGEHGQIGHP